MKFFSRAAAVLLLILVFFSTIQTIPAFAQTNQISMPSYVTNDMNPDVPQNLHSLTQVVATEVISTMICQIAGIDPMKRDQACLGIDPQTHKIGFVKNSGGLLGATMQGIDMTFNLPVHSGDYLQYMAGKFGTEKTYAAPAPKADTTYGIGWAGLHPLLNLWVAFRNIVYLFFVIIFVLLGVGIMLQIQVDPRTVMTLENQLPKIIAGLILVTFSYAIAGVMVDLMWVLTFLIINILAGTDPAQPGLANLATINVLLYPIQYADKLFNTTGITGILQLTGGGVTAFKTVLDSIFTTDGLKNFQIGGPAAAPQQAGGGCPWYVFLSPLGPLDPVAAACAGAAVVGQAGSNIASTVWNMLGFMLGWFLASIVGLIIFIALVITMFRIWFSLLRAYIFILIDVILAPLHIAAGLIPGSSIGFGTWFRSMAANLLTFPVTIAMFVLARVLVDSFFPTGVNLAPGASLFIPPLIGNPNGGTNTNPLGAFIALGVIFAIPEVLNTMRNIMQTVNSTLSAAAFSGAATGARVARGGASSFTAGLINPTTGRFEGGFRLGRLLSRI